MPTKVQRADDGLHFHPSEGRLATGLKVHYRADGNVWPGLEVLEIKPADLHKGTAVARWLNTEHPDFILALGDDRTDEDTFAALPPSAYTVRVGRAPRSLARYSVPSPTEVRQLLRRLPGVMINV